MAHKTIIGKFLIWRVKHMDDRYFVILLSVIIGFLAGVAAFLLKTTVFEIQKWLIGGFEKDEQNFWFVVYPAIGIFLTLIFLKFVIRDDVKHGIPRILYVISKNKSRMKRHKIFSSLFGGSLTAGFGGSIGLESPIISTGASIGSNTAQLLRLNYRTTTLLIGCGAAGAMASIFNTPIAAVIFGLEVLMLDLATSSIVPLLIASVTGSITTKFMFPDQVLIHFQLEDPFVAGNIPFFILLGIITGLISFYFSKISGYIGTRLARISKLIPRTVLGMILLGLVIFLFPPLYGEGYDAIKAIIAGNPESLMNESFFFGLKDNAMLVVLFFVLLIFFKVIATSLTIESGGVGGIFAPSAVVGGFSGFAFAHGLNQLDLSSRLSESNFTLVGMAGVLSGVLHAPLTAIFLVAEITNGYDLIVPLMITTTFAFVTSKVLDPHSIFTRQLAERGELITHHKDQAVLTLMSIRDVIDTDLSLIAPGTRLGDLVNVIAESHRNIFPVVGEDDKFYGVVLLDDVRKDMFRVRKYDTPIEKYLIHLDADEKVCPYDSMEVVMEKFNKTGHYNLAVIDHDKYIGFVSRANVFKKYRKTLIDVSHE